MTLLEIFKDYPSRAMVVAQLAEQSLPTPEISGSKSDIGKEFFWTYLSVNCYPEKTKKRKKSRGMTQLKKDCPGQGRDWDLLDFIYFISQQLRL